MDMDPDGTADVICDSVLLLLLLLILDTMTDVLVKVAPLQATKLDCCCCCCCC